ncbi:MAG TPA: hypothetical protein VK575_01135 [Gemmatimonadaceae bacterium]|jgi:hypothetical protein|nr:hypothetical protein [Gemmatimonadaceae bacterium]
MTITVRDEDQGVEINLGPSESVPTATSVTIFAREVEMIEFLINSMRQEYGYACFSIPAHCADGQWGVHGTVGPSQVLPPGS